MSSMAEMANDNNRLESQLMTIYFLWRQISAEKASIMAISVSQ
jgi:hypothetical protein